MVAVVPVVPMMPTLVPTMVAPVMTAMPTVMPTTMPMSMAADPAAMVAVRLLDQVVLARDAGCVRDAGGLAGGAEPKGAKGDNRRGDE